MQAARQRLAPAALAAFAVLGALGAALAVPMAAAQTGSGAPPGGSAGGSGQGPGAAVDGSPAEGGPVVVHVGMHLISFGSYDTAKGTYVMDVYLRLAWDNASAPEGFRADRFEFSNGRATSKDLQSDTVLEDGTREVWYRVQAALYSPPDFQAYPFDRQRLSLVLEDAVHPQEELVYALDASITLDEDVRIPGWRIRSWEASVVAKPYPFGETYSRLEARLELGREPVASALRSFLPPLAFVLVASFSFFFDKSQAPARLTLGTGMLITAVGFHISQTVQLPTAALTLFDQVMICVYVFIAATLLVTTALAWGEKLILPEKVTRLINSRGAYLAVAMPLLVFLLLRFL